MWKKFKPEFHYFVWFTCLQNLDVFLGKFSAELVLKSFSGRNNSLEPLFLDFLTVFHMIWRNQESFESWLVGLWVRRHSKMQKNSANNFFAFLSCHYGSTSYFEILIFTFSNIIPQKFQPVKYYFSRVSSFRKMKL